MNRCKLEIYHFEPTIRTLGPGKRAGIWVQGCQLGCSGCLVPDSHAKGSGHMVDVSDMKDKIASNQNIEGITISGGEPFEQVESLSRLITTIMQIRPELSLMIFTGYRIGEWQSSEYGSTILKHTDILVDGPFVRSKASSDAWRGSQNQCIHFLSNRYTLKDYTSAPIDRLEFLIRPGNGLFMAGIPSQHVLKKLGQTLWPDLAQ